MLTASAAFASTPDLASCDVWRLACHYTDSSRESSYNINRVVIHKGEGATASGGASWFANCDSGGSAHYFFDKANGYCYQCVYEADIAWHAGNWTTNCNSIGIEHSGWTANNDTSTACYNESAIETKSCVTYYAVPCNRSYIIGHSEVPGCGTPGGGGTSCHTDPGRYWNWTYYISKCNPSSSGSYKGPSMFYETGPGSMNIYRWAPSGSSFSTLTQTGIASGYSLSAIGQHMAATDVDGDGDDDNVVAYQYPDGSMRLHVFRNGSSYDGPEGWWDSSGGFPMANVGGRMAGGDFDGNGKGDIVMFYDTGSGVRVYRFLSNGSSFTYDTATISSGYSLEEVGDNIAAADVNGDGKTDAILAYQYPDGTMRLHVFINGNSYAGPAGWFQSGPFDLANVNGRMAGGDFDGNGKGDVAMLYDNGSGVTAFRFLSNGSSFSYDSSTISSGYSLESVGKHMAAGNVDGDGDSDVVVAYQYADGTFRYHVWLNGITYQGPTGWYQSGAFNLDNVAGRMTMGKWQ